MVKFITVPNPILRKKSKPVRQIDADLRRLIKELKKALVKAHDPQGVGLSAVQINELKRIFLARPSIKTKPQVFINPKIIWRSQKLISGVSGRKNNLEGCLSVPGYYGLVKRHQEIKLRYQTIHNSKFVIHHSKFKGFLATVIQHELDHLNGILFIDRVLEQGNKLYKIEADELLESAL